MYKRDQPLCYNNKGKRGKNEFLFTEIINIYIKFSIFI